MSKHSTRKTKGSKTKEETWISVVGCEGEYEISSKGLIKSLARTCVRNRRAHYLSERILKPFSSRQPGYLQVDIRGRKRKGRFSIHVLVLEAFVGPRPKGMVARHLDGNPRNNDVENLCWGTVRENSEDMVKHGRGGRVAKKDH